MMKTAMLVSVALVALVGCGGTEEAETPAAPAPAAEAPAPAANPAPAPTVTAEVVPAAEGAPEGPETVTPGGNLCERAQQCCAAYVAAMPTGGPQATAQAACDTLRQTATTDEACTQSILNYRHALTFLEAPVPPACR
jgi:hypothetical protein